MILELIVNNKTRNEIAKIMTSNIYIINYHELEMKIIILSTKDVDSTTTQYRYLAKKT